MRARLKLYAAAIQARARIIWTWMLAHPRLTGVILWLLARFTPFDEIFYRFLAWLLGIPMPNIPLPGGQQAGTQPIQGGAQHRRGPGWCAIIFLILFVLWWACAGITAWRAWSSFQEWRQPAPIATMTPDPREAPETPTPARSPVATVTPYPTDGPTPTRAIGAPWTPSPVPTVTYAPTETPYRVPSPTPSKTPPPRATP
jgi:hypothetical protein